LNAPFDRDSHPDPAERGGSVGYQGAAIDHKNFGMYLRRIREERRLSLDAVEEMSLGLPERVTKSHLSRIENGQAIPTFPRMFTLSQIYGLPVSFLAERFELFLKRGMFPADVFARSTDEILGEAKRFRTAGRHAEALVLYEAVLEKLRENSGGKGPHEIVDLKLQCINCQVKLAREATAKDQCEELLGSPWLTDRQRVITLQYFVMCCYKLSKFTVAMMAIDKAESELARIEDAADLAAHLAVLKGNLLFVTKRFPEAAVAFREALERFEQLPDPFEACRTRLNLAATLIEMGSRASAREHLLEALHRAEASGYDRQRAFALSHLALLAFKEGDLATAEAHCLRSNALARPREYVSILFRNCYYLWRIARERNDVAAVKTNERTLRTYVNRVEADMPEAEDFRSHLGGGTTHD
jgi:tetratricopeptide (TPR) repeat protein